jgi:hypothetical protein
MCVETDAPARLLAGEHALRQYENELSLFPNWLGFLAQTNALRGLATFAVQFWFYAQLDCLGLTGKACPDMSVFAATRRVMRQQSVWLKARGR